MLILYILSLSEKNINIITLYCKIRYNLNASLANGEIHPFHIGDIAISKAIEGFGNACDALRYSRSPNYITIEELLILEQRTKFFELIKNFVCYNGGIGGILSFLPITEQNRFWKYIQNIQRQYILGNIDTPEKIFENILNSGMLNVFDPSQRGTLKSFLTQRNFDDYLVFLKTRYPSRTAAAPQPYL